LNGEGIAVEGVDPRSLTPLDADTIVNFVKKSGRVGICEEGCRTAGVGAEITAQIIEHAFDYLDAPVVRVAGRDIPVPCTPVLEQAALPDVSDIVDAVRVVLV